MKNFLKKLSIAIFIFIFGGATYGTIVYIAEKPSYATTLDQIAYGSGYGIPMVLLNFIIAAIVTLISRNVKAGIVTSFFVAFFWEYLQSIAIEEGMKAGYPWLLAAVVLGSIPAIAIYVIWAKPNIKK